MDDNYLRARLDSLAGTGNYTAVIDLACISKRHALGFRNRERDLSPLKREELVAALTRVDRGEVRFEKHRERSQKTGRPMRGQAKTYAVPVDRPVETNFPLRYANELFGSLRSKSHGHQNLFVQTLPQRGRLLGK